MGRQNPEKSEKIYRLSFFEDSTHKKIKTLRFSKSQLIYGLVSAVVLGATAIWLIFALTPIRNTIPGYPDARARQAAVSNAIKIDSLENAVARWTLYAENLSRVLTGQEAFDYGSIISGGKVEYLSDKSSDQLARQDSVLRRTVREEEQFGVSAARERSLPIQGMHFFSPVKGVVALEFDAISHPAIDITAPSGTVVKSVLDGTVVFSGWDDEDGYYLVMQHKDNVLSIFNHCSRLLIRDGEQIKAGTPVALVGNTGIKEQTAHLHFGLWHNGEALDPQKYISF